MGKSKTSLVFVEKHKGVDIFYDTEKLEFVAVFSENEKFRHRSHWELKGLINTTTIKTLSGMAYHQDFHEIHLVELISKSRENVVKIKISEKCGCREAGRIKEEKQSEIFPLSEHNTKIFEEYKLWKQKDDECYNKISNLVDRLERKL